MKMNPETIAQLVSKLSDTTAKIEEALKALQDLQNQYQEQSNLLVIEVGNKEDTAPQFLCAGYLVTIDWEADESQIDWTNGVTLSKLPTI